MLRSLFPFFNGIVFTIALIAAGGYVAVRQGLIPAGADVKAPGIERWAAHVSLDATLDRETKSLTNPLQPTDANLIAGVTLYAANCAVCHGAADAKASNLAKGFYIRAPQLAEHGVEDDDESESYWKVDHGIRFSAMPEEQRARCERERAQHRPVGIERTDAACGLLRAPHLGRRCGPNDMEIERQAVGPRRQNVVGGRHCDEPDAERGNDRKRRLPSVAFAREQDECRRATDGEHRRFERTSGSLREPEPIDGQRDRGSRRGEPQRTARAAQDDERREEGDVEIVFVRERHRERKRGARECEEIVRTVSS